MLLTSAVTLWFAAAMSYPSDMFTDAPGAAGPESQDVPAWSPPQDVFLPADDAGGERDDLMTRVGRSSGSQELEPDSDTYARLDRGKMGNFVRLGRWRPDNFVRLGRGKQLDSNFLRFGRADSFIRFGRDKAQNYIRFGRNRPDSFIRLGRPERKELEELLGDDYLHRDGRGGQTGTPRIRSRKGDVLDGDLVGLGGGKRVSGDAEGFQRSRRTGSPTFGRGKLTDSNFIRLGRSGARSAREKRSAPDEDDVEGVSGQSFLYPPLAADLPTYILGPELSFLPQPSGLALAANTKREKNYIRFG